MTKYDKVIKKYGTMTQILQAMEESGEMVVVLNHYLRGRVDVKEVMKELVDNHIMNEQMRVVFGIDEGMFEEAYNKELNKLTGECDD